MTIEKHEVFDTELNYIQNEALRSFAKNVLDAMPDYFYVVPASSSGKYHPAYALGKGGLVRHTKAAIRFAMELSRNTTLDVRTSLDEVICALLFHDGVKCGPDGDLSSTDFLHPLYASNVVREVAKSGHDGVSYLSISFIQILIESHMGQWNQDKEGNEVLPLPITDAQKFVHLCDYLASRKCIDVNFDNHMTVNVPETGIGDLSDGYHTFNELYDHRAILFSVICNANPDKAWKSLKHHDGTMFENMFIVGINTPHGQATYHYDFDPYWRYFNVPALESAPEWDGHTPKDAINRLLHFGGFHG